MSAKFTWNGNTVKDAMRDAAIEGLRDAANAILADASNLVPHDEGQLENSGDTFIDTNKLEAHIFFDRPYAIRQHEDTSLRHPNGRTAKYLEKPLNERGKELLEYVATYVKRSMG